MVYTVVDDCGIAQPFASSIDVNRGTLYSKSKKINSYHVSAFTYIRLDVFIQIGIIHSDTWKIGSRSVNNFKVKVKFCQGQSLIKILLSTTNVFLFFIRNFRSEHR